MAKPKNDKNKGNGKGQEKNLDAGNSKNPRLKRQSTPKPAYSVESVMRTLRTKKNVAQVVVPIPGGNATKTVIVFTSGSLGIRMLGGVDYLVTVHGYGKKIVSQAVFNNLVKAKKITPFVALKDATAE